MKETMLSVIVPVFNTSRYIIRCLDSLVNQSIKDIEIIVINDGSTDDSDKILTEYIKIHSNFEYIRLEKNKGLGFARNVGINIAKSKYITFVDSDDWVDLDLYEIMCTTLDRDNTDIAICGIKNEYSNSCLSEPRYTYLYPNIINTNALLNLLTKSTSNNYYISPVVWNKVYKKSIFTHNNLYFLNNSYWEDDVFCFILFSFVKNASLIPNIYYHYYMRPKSITKSISKKHIDDLISSFCYLKEKINVNGNPNLELKFNELFDRCICSLFKMITNNEPDFELQKKYIIYLFTKFSEEFSIKKAIEYLDIERIKRLFY